MHFDFVLLPVAYPDRYLSLIAYLCRQQEWTLSFTDGTSMLFARTEHARDEAVDLGDPAVTDRLLSDIERRYGHSTLLAEAARLQLATLTIAAGEAEQAERVLNVEHSHDADALRTRARLVSGDVTGAAALARRLLGSAADPGTYDLIAMVRLRSGHLHDALPWVERALRIDPFDAEAGHLLSSMEEHP